MSVPAVSSASRRALWPCIAVFVVACGGGNDASEASRSVPGAPLRIEANPLLSVGVVEGDVNQQFDRVVTPFLLPDGRLVVPVAGASSIRIFAANGEFVTSLGHAGEGPGEFKWLIAAWPRGDTIEALDLALQRITRFYPDGSVDVVTLQPDIRDLSAVAGPVPDGWVVGGVAFSRMGERDTIAVQRFDLSGALRGDVGRVAGFARYQAPDLSGPEPLSPRCILAVALGRVWLAETLTPRIEVRASADAVERAIVWQPEREFDVSETMREVIDSAVARAGPEQAQRIRQRLEAAPLPERLSVFWKFIVDDAGFIWIRDYEPRLHAAALGGLAPGGVGQGGRWRVLSAEGEPVASIDVPPELEPVRITADAVVGISRDALGVERVRVHRLRRTS